MINRVRSVFAVLAAALIALVLIPAAPAQAGNAQESLHSHKAQGVTASVAVTVTAADVLAATSTTARPGEGVIRITTRVCGNANNWQNVAASNGVRPPVYLVLLGQRLLVSCTGGSAPAPQQQSAPTSGWVAPVNACIVSGFGMRWGRMHNGVDLNASYGTAIRAAAAGTVSVGYQAGGAGNYVMINHGGGIWTVSMHLSSFAVRSGWVNTGQIIGYVGATGNATRYVNGVLRSFPHLHFETHAGGIWHGRVDPRGFMSARGVTLRWC